MLVESLMSIGNAVENTHRMETPMSQVKGGTRLQREVDIWGAYMAALEAEAAANRSPAQQPQSDAEPTPHEEQNQSWERQKDILMCKARRCQESRATWSRGMDADVKKVVDEESQNVSEQDPPLSPSTELRSRFECLKSEHPRDDDKLPSPTRSDKPLPHGDETLLSPREAAPAWSSDYVINLSRHIRNSPQADEGLQSKEARSNTTDSFHEKAQRHEERHPEAPEAEHHSPSDFKTRWSAFMTQGQKTKSPTKPTKIKLNFHSADTLYDMSSEDQAWCALESKASCGLLLTLEDIPIPSPETLINCGKSEERALFKKLAMRYHPDKFMQKFGKVLDPQQRESIGKIIQGISQRLLNMPDLVRSV